jgi:hypothetical protein
MNDDWKNYKDILDKKKLKIYLENRNGYRPIDGISSSEYQIFLNLVHKSYINQLRLDTEWSDTNDKKIFSILENGGYNDYIMKKIMDGKSYPRKKKTIRPIKMIKVPTSNITHFSAYTYNYICFLYYILEKYPDIKIPMTTEIQMEKKTIDIYHDMIANYKEKTPDNSIFRSIIRDYVNHSPALINHIIIWKDRKIHFFSPFIAQGIHETIKKYPKTKFILLKLTILSEKKFNHSNILLYDIHEKQVERFDPYGQVPFIDNKYIDQVLISFFRDNFSDVRYLSPSQLTDSISFQIFSDENNINNYIKNDPSGFCVAWCLWYVEMRINNDDFQPQTLIKKAIFKINKNENKFKDYIRNYSNYLDSKKNEILEKANVPEKYWYALYLPINFYKNYLKYIRQLYSNIIG